MKQKRYILLSIQLLIGLIFLALAISNSYAQSTMNIPSGITITANDNVVLTLNDMDLSNDGLIQPGESVICFAGNLTTAISGNSIPSLNTTMIRKSEKTASVLLNTNLNVSGQINLVGGNIDLNGHDINLGTSGEIAGETKDSRIYGTSGSITAINRSAKANQSNNIANLGLVISNSAESLSGINIIRGVSAANNINNSSSGSINRHYNIELPNDSSSSTRLKFNYFENEYDSSLFATDKSSLILWKTSDQGVTWEPTNSTSNPTDNSVTLDDVSRISYQWTVGPPPPPKPIPLAHAVDNFSVQCRNENKSFSWCIPDFPLNELKDYTIQASLNGTEWNDVDQGSFSESKTNYSCEYKNNPYSTDYTYFRLLIVHQNGKSATSKTVHSKCLQTNMEDIRVYPNPSSHFLNVTVKQTDLDNGPAKLQVYNADGSLMAEQQVQQCKTTFIVDQWNAGTYVVKVSFQDHVIMKRIIIL